MNSAHWTTFARTAGVEHRLTKPARHLLLLLSTGVDWATGENTWTTDRVMQDLGCGRSAYHSALRELVDHGLVEHHRAAPGRRAGWRLDDDADHCYVCVASGSPEPNGSGEPEATDETDAAGRTNGSGQPDSTDPESRANGSGQPQPVSVSSQSSSQSELTSDGATAVARFVDEHPKQPGSLKWPQARQLATEHFDGRVDAIAAAMLYGDDRTLIDGYLSAAEADAAAVAA
ncbi:MAG TPA: hypothetical protein VGM33_12735 [Baekduia sp.]|jgi:hypothetical protein